jgi:hypothetical protein
MAIAYSLSTVVGVLAVLAIVVYAALLMLTRKEVAKAP